MPLNPGGLVLCLNEGIEPDYSGPWDMILGYMAFNLQGMPMGVIKRADCRYSKNSRL